MTIFKSKKVKEKKIISDKSKQNQKELNWKEEYEKLERGMRVKERELESSKSHYKNQKHARREVEEEVRQSKQETEEVKKASKKALLIEKLMTKYWKKQAEREEENATSHFKAIKVCEDWYLTHHIVPLKSKEKVLKSQLSDKTRELEENIAVSKKNYKDQSELLKTARETINDQEAEIRNLRRELKEKQELLEKSHEIINDKENENQELQKQLNKSLSKKRKNEEVESQHIEKKIKVQNQIMVAQIEVKKQ